MKNQLDEMQEQKLLKIEHNGCWFAFGALFISLAIEAFLFNFEFKVIAAEFIIFMVLDLYLVGACLKNGIWDRRLKPDRKTNLAVSAISSALLSILATVGSYFKFSPHMTVPALLMIFAFIFLGTFFVSYIALAATARDFKKQQAKLENALEEEENED